MLQTVEFKVMGAPVGKARPRFTRSGHVYTDPKTKDYEKSVGQAAWVAMLKSRLRPTDKRVSVIMSHHFKIPKSYSKAKVIACQAGSIIPPTYDLDNLAKSILDGCNKIVWDDDASVWHLTCFKRYCDVDVEPHTQVRIQWDDGRPEKNIL